MPQRFSIFTVQQIIHNSKWNVLYMNFNDSPWYLGKAAQKTSFLHYELLKGSIFTRIGPGFPSLKRLTDLPRVYTLVLLIYFKLLSPF